MSKPLGICFWREAPRAVVGPDRRAGKRGLHGQEMKSECYIPTVIDTLIQSEQTECAVIETNGAWFGVTYPDDKPFVQASIAALIASGEYPEAL